MVTPRPVGECWFSLLRSSRTIADPSQLPKRLLTTFDDGLVLLAGPISFSRAHLCLRSRAVVVLMLIGPRSTLVGGSHLNSALLLRCGISLNK